MPGRVDELAAAFANYAQVRGGESGLQGRAQPLQEMVLAGRPFRGDDRIHGRVAQQSLLARCPRLPEASEHTLKARSQALDRPAGPLVSGVCLEIHSRDAQPLEGVAEQEKLRLDVDAASLRRGGEPGEADLDREGSCAAGERPEVEVRGTSD